MNSKNGLNNGVWSAGEEGEDYINFDGNKVSNKEDIQLPPLI